MSDQITDPAEEPTPDTEAAAQEPQGTDATDWKVEARKWEKRAKDAQVYREDADKWREYEASLKPAQERLAEELATAKADAEAARVSLLRYEVAAEKQLPAEAIHLLTGATREDLEAAADTLLALIANQSKPQTPKPDLSQGKPAANGSTTADQFAAALGGIL